MALTTDRVYAITAACEGYEPISVDVEIPLGTGEFTVPLVVERTSNLWIFVGAGVVVAAIFGAVLVVRRRRAGAVRGRPPRGRDRL